MYSHVKAVYIFFFTSHNHVSPMYVHFYSCVIPTYSHTSNIYFEQLRILCITPRPLRTPVALKCVFWRAFQGYLFTLKHDGLR